MQGRQHMPPGHPCGYDFDVDLPGWNDTTYESTADDIAAANENPAPYIDLLRLDAEPNVRSGLYWARVVQAHPDVRLHASWAENRLRLKPHAVRS